MQDGENEGMYARKKTTERGVGGAVDNEGTGGTRGKRIGVSGGGRDKLTAARREGGAVGGANHGFEDTETCRGTQVNYDEIKKETGWNTREVLERREKRRKEERAVLKVRIHI